MPEFSFSEFNILAIIVATIAAFLVGGFWYAGAFAKAWVSAHGYTQEQAEALGKNPQKTFPIIIATQLVSAFFMSVLIHTMDITSAFGGVALAAILWAGVAAPIVMADNAAHSRKLACFFVDGSYHLVYLIVQAAILAAWQ